MARNVIEILITAKDQTKKTLALTTKQLKEFARAAGVAGTAMVAVGVQMFRAASQADRLTTATDNLAKALGETDDEMITGITSAAKGMISDMQAARAANQAMMFKIVENKEQMQELAQIAVVLGNAMGQAAGKSIEDMTLGLGRQSKMILDNLGIIVNVEQAYEDYAESLGKTASALTDAEKQQAFTTAALEAGRAKAEELGGVAVDSAGKVDQLTAAWANFYVEFGRVLTALNESTGALDVANGWIDRLTEGAKAWQQNLEDAAGWMDIQARAAENLGIAVGTQNAAIMQGKLTQDEWKEALTEAGEQLTAESEAADATTKILGDYAAAQETARRMTNARSEATRISAEALRNEAQAAYYTAVAQQEAQEAYEQAQITNANIAAGTVYNNAADLRRAKEVTDEIDHIRTRRTELSEHEKELNEESVTEAERKAAALKRIADQSAQDMANTISSVIQPSLSQVWSPDGEEQHVDEWARRLADIATGKLDSEWVGPLKEKFGGADFFQPLMEALESGDSEGAIQAARDILTNNVTSLYDKDLIKEKVKEKLQQDNARDELIKTVQDELAAEGVAVSTGVIATAAGDATAAQEETKTSLNEVATAATEMGDTASLAFETAITATDKWIKRVDALNTKLGISSGHLESIKNNMDNVAPAGGVGDGTSIEQIGGMVE
jgi:hypothetical protein